MVITHHLSPRSVPFMASEVQFRCGMRLPGKNYHLIPGFWVFSRGVEGGGGETALEINFSGPSGPSL